MNPRFLKVLACAGVLLALPAENCNAQSALEDSPRLIWEKSMRWVEQADLLARQRRLTEALGFLARSRFMLRKLREHWPNYRRLKIASEIHNIQKRKESICKLVGDQGLVEYHGKFYTFEQIRQLLQFEQERSAKWMALLKAQEEIRRARTERMVKDESKRQIPTANAVQVPTVAPTTKPSKSPKPRSDQDEQNRLNQLLK